MEICRRTVKSFNYYRRVWDISISHANYFDIDMLLYSLYIKIMVNLAQLFLRIFRNPRHNLCHLIVYNLLNPRVEDTILQSQVRAMETTWNNLKWMLRG